MREGGTLGPVATTALLAERVIDKMRGNHQTTACHRHGHLGRVRGEAIAEIRSGKNESQASDHQAKHS
jgi:hypothetical protein